MAKSGGDGILVMSVTILVLVSGGFFVGELWDYSYSPSSKECLQAEEAADSRYYWFVRDGRDPAELQLAAEVVLEACPASKANNLLRMKWQTVATMVTGAASGGLEYIPIRKLEVGEEIRISIGYYRLWCDWVIHPVPIRSGEFLVECKEEGDLLYAEILD